ncbi:N-acetylglucosamine-6-phosphate deacetylase [Spirosoma linguale]|uniref:N-acetylglucosamine-6-phosphate deacetylase n=1 Tax=Spirosoma linguale (strain ATCC 33905 / DSM 74 / LMG 10896 / Claus 1) TaxID=504472 RepID=D2QTN9_SPILD|nr:N-acetylglucosamine-6-phosphate deacetylase [Spirosoma linguale DSM 74]
MMPLDQNTTPLVLSGIHYQTHEPVDVMVASGIITDIQKREQAPDETLPFIGPGLVDMQVNGFAGVDFNDATLTVDGVIAITQSLLKLGVTTFYPTVITNADDTIRTILQTIHQACETSSLVASCIGGIHLEGPFISPEEGPLGAHPKAHVKPPDWSLLQSFIDASGGRIRLITLSPEWPGSADFIRQCVEHGLLVAIGHTAASPAQIQEAVDAGARLSTHLGNAAHQLLPRHPNYIWEQLAQDGLAASVIADGFHLPPSVLKVIFRMKAEKAILISDSVSLGGLPAGNYQSPVGGEVTLTDEGKLHLAGKPTVLAGSAQPLLWGVNQVVRLGLASLDKAWEMASIHPSRLLNLPQQGGLTIGAPADLVLFRAVEVIKVYKKGCDTEIRRDCTEIHREK